MTITATREVKGAAMPQIWAGIDAGKGHHHCVVIDAAGAKLHTPPASPTTRRRCSI
ncbi:MULTISPECIES: IS110 family transposase [unclassified Rathayibacter]|uniref:IS110 family transposase n=1 Tax=unclassified Rathayibacter TaxID=2609250 RepID=UPI0011B0731A|nr:MULTISPECIES: IS110 family transposase [unclassified Rathayibacter]